MAARPYTEKIAAQQRKYRAAHRDEILAKKKAYYQRHRERLLAAMAEYQRTHRSQLAEARARRKTRPGATRKHYPRTPAQRLKENAYKRSAHGKAYKKAWRQRQRTHCTDGYIANVIYGCAIKSLAPELLEATRALLQVRAVVQRRV